MLVKLFCLFLFISLGATQLLPQLPIPESIPLEKILKNLKNVGVAAPCNSILLSHCQVTFNTALGIRGIADWTNPAVLQAALTNIVTVNGTRGMLQICG